MSDDTLVLLETSGIQPYVFGSNHLMQNIGASELVARATTAWVADALADLDSNVAGYDPAAGLQLSQRGVRQGAEAEVIYSGGGNVLLYFARTAPARQFINAITRRALKDAPGLQLVAAYEPFNWESAADSLLQAERVLRERIGRRKQSRPRSRPQPGLAVTAQGVFTGLPAVGLTDDSAVVGPLVARRIGQRGETPRLVSSPVAARLRAVGDAEERLDALLPQVEERGFAFAYDFDQFGEKGTSSYIAVIHVDGNRMGQRFQALGDQAENNETYVSQLRALSQSVKDQAKDALQETVDALLNSLDERGRFGGEVPAQGDPAGQRLLLPFRPLVFGGDDTTFVCEGRMGLALAKVYLESYTSGYLEGDWQAITARAGVAIVKTHYPFSRAYRLSEDLAARAKRAIGQAFGRDEANVLDWHVSTSGVLRSLDDTRRREYMDGALLMRPLLVEGDGWRSWTLFESMVDYFRKDEDWRTRRNKVLAMREALRGGGEAFSLFLRNYGIDPKKELPEIPGQPRARQTGWHDDGHCAYYDAIEATDFFVPVIAPEEGR